MLELTPEIIHDWKNAINNVKNKPGYYLDRLLMSLNASQLESKRWLVDEISSDTEIKKVAIVAGWYAPYLPQMLFDKFSSIERVTNYEMDMDLAELARTVNQRHCVNDTYQFVVRDAIFETHLFQDAYELVINTSCEHMYPMKHFVRETWSVLKGAMWAFQSTNDRRHEEHINCVDSADELADQSGLMDILYAGERELSNGTTRYMVIGRAI